MRIGTERSKTLIVVSTDFKFVEPKWTPLHTHAMRSALRFEREMPQKTVESKFIGGAPECKML
jgi:hypothetical protein